MFEHTIIADLWPREQLPGNSAGVTRVRGGGSKFRDSAYADRGVGVRVQFATAALNRKNGVVKRSAPMSCQTLRGDCEC